jgi:hypothetical protein
MEKLATEHWPVLLCGFLALCLLIALISGGLFTKKKTNLFLKLVVTIVTDYQRKVFKVYAFITYATVMQTFQSLCKSLSGNLDSLCLTPEEREAFCRDYFDQLSPNGYTYFLEKRGDDFFVVGVSVHSHDSHECGSFSCKIENDRRRGGNDSRDRVVVRKP